MVPEHGTIWSTDAFDSFGVPLGRFGGASLGQAGFRMGPQIITLAHHLEKVMKKYIYPKTRTKKNMSLQSKAAPKMNGLKSKVSVWQVICCKVQSSGCREVLRKSMPKRIPKTVKICAQNAPRSDFRDVGAIWEDPKFNRFWGREKVD